MSVLTVEELRNSLNELIESGHAHTPVKFAYNYGDHSHTEVAANIHELTVGKTEYSDYHQMDKVVELDDEIQEYDLGPEVDGVTVILS